MKTLLALLVALMAALVIYTATQDIRAMKIEAMVPPDPRKAVPVVAVLRVLAPHRIDVRHSHDAHLHLEETDEEAGRAAIRKESLIPLEAYDRLRIEKGIRVQEKIYKNNEECEQILASGEHFDLVMVPDYIARHLDRLDLSVDIDYSRIPNHRNIVAGVRRAEVMGSLFRCAVPFFFGTVALSYDTRHVGALPLKWSALFDPTTPKLLRARMALIDDPRLSLGIALLALGKNPNSRDPAEVRAAGEYIKRSMAHLIRLGDDDNIESGLRDEHLYLAMAVGSDIAMAMETNVHLRFVSPDEGSLLLFKCFVIMRDTQQRAAAETLIDFMLRPEISAEISDISFYGSLNEMAMPYLNRELFNGPAYYFPRGRQLHFRDDLGDDEQLYRDVWRDVRAYYNESVKPTLDHTLGFGGAYIDGNDRPHAPAPLREVKKMPEAMELRKQRRGATAPVPAH